MSRPLVSSPRDAGTDGQRVRARLAAALQYGVGLPPQAWSAAPQSALAESGVDAVLESAIDRDPGTISGEAVDRWLQLLPEQVHGLLWTVDAELVFTSIGSSEHAFGAPADALLGTSLYDLLQTDDAGIGPIANHLLALQGRAGSYESAFAHRVFQYRLAPLIGPGGEIHGVIGTAVDVTERKRSESALRAQDERVRFLIEQVPAILWTTDRELRVTSSAGAGLASIGQRPDALVGVSLHDYLDPARFGQAPLDCHHDALRGVSGSFEGTWSGRDYQTWVQPLRDAEDRVAGVVGLTIDVTDRKQAERQREELLEREQRAREQAEAANRMKDEFLATVSHELRTPLNSILGWAHLLREDESKDELDPETRTRALETIERNSRSQARLIQDLLDVSHIVTGRTRLDIRPASDLRGVINSALDSLRPAAVAKSIRLDHRLDADAGPILADPERLQQIVWNLVSNAIKFTPVGGSVDVRLECLAGKVTVRVADTGEGIAPAFLPYVFDRFRQADSSSSRRHSGLGLGLAIVRHLVELQGGEVSVESAGVGRGATFAVSFPLLPMDVPALQESDDLAVEASLEPSLDGLRVMAIDDEPDTLEMIRAILERCRATVRTATSALEGLDQLERWKPDVLLADIGMPERDGFWLIRRVRGLTPEGGGKVPAVALTAFARSEDRLRTLSAGFQTHVAKPLEPEELIAVVARLCQVRG